MSHGEDALRILAWSDVLEDATYYELLGILEIADDAAVKAAFHQFALAFHPDRLIGHDAETLSAARRVFQRGAEAYRVLSHPELRPKYDMALAKGQLRLGEGEVPRNAALDRGARSLDELCKTAAAKLCARKADQLINDGELAAAKKQLMMARYHDGENADIDERIDALDLALFAMGE